VRLIVRPSQQTQNFLIFLGYVPMGPIWHEGRWMEWNRIARHIQTVHQRCVVQFVVPQRALDRAA